MEASVTTLRMDRLAYPVTSLGPGRRVVLWVAGCSRRCVGCITPHLLEWDSGKDVAVEDIAERLATLPMPLDGLTLSGGDPADQPEAVVSLLDEVRRLQPGWNILMYTGDRVEKMRTRPAQAALLGLLDVLIDGPYERDVLPTHPLAGSGNQRVLALSATGEEMVRAMEAPSAPFNVGLGAPDDVFLIGVSTADARRQAHILLHQFPPEPPCAST